MACSSETDTSITVPSATRQYALPGKFALTNATASASQNTADQAVSFARQQINQA
ncbi:hypothetical protein OU5_P0130 (plasmid) [Pseudomonas mandelii JR-1]|uniref:Uncharacterized protein n=1 Tax=Pseudomonas mandelii JR-1 TaxID=1147786 RepID=A0A024EKR0_9PSED|nr:hypothetical protein OU5_P0130 [Pseudomonas mandelii JR-1]